MGACQNLVLYYNVIYCITCTSCEKIYIGKTERRLDDRFLGDVERNDKDASKPVPRRFNLPDHQFLTSQDMTDCGLSLHQGKTESLGGRVAEWLGCWTSSPWVPGSNPTLSTSWICFSVVPSYKSFGCACI